MKQMLIVLLVVFGFGFATSSQCHASMAYEFDVTMTNVNDGKTAPPVHLHTTEVGKQARVDVLTTSDDWVKGDYLITKDEGHTFNLVSPSRKTIHLYDDKAFLAQFVKSHSSVSLGGANINLEKPTSCQYNLYAFCPITFRAGLIYGKGNAVEVAELSLSKQQDNGPLFNPITNYRLMDFMAMMLSSPQLKDHGLASILPNGFVQHMRLQLDANVHVFLAGHRHQVYSTEITTMPPSQATVTDSLFEIPSVYRCIS